MTQPLLCDRVIAEQRLCHQLKTLWETSEITLCQQFIGEQLPSINKVLIFATGSSITDKLHMQVPKKYCYSKMINEVKYRNNFKYWDR